MRRILILLASCNPLVVLGSSNEGRAAEPIAPIRGILVQANRITPEFLTAWKARGASSVVVPLDEETKRRWGPIAETVERTGMTLHPWIEVARNPRMAEAHPEWMAAVGGHHDDWRRRFPHAPKSRLEEVVKAWPWVPIGYAPAFDAHRKRLNALLSDLPGAWSGVFLNDLQAGPSSCGCGNDQCRWALDYGTPSTSVRVPGDDAASRLVAELRKRHPGKDVVPVWVTECEPIDLPGAKSGTGLCGSVACADGECWPRYARAWNPLLKATDGPIAVALWSETFRRDPDRWIAEGFDLFRKPPRGASPLSANRGVAVIQAWDKPEANVERLLDRVKRTTDAWILALDPIDQSWEPRALPAGRR